MSWLGGTHILSLMSLEKKLWVWTAFAPLRSSWIGMVKPIATEREPRCLSCLELSSCVSDFWRSSASMSMLQLKYLLLGPFQGQLRLAYLNGSSPQQNIQQDQFGMQQSMQYGHQQYGNSQYGQPPTATSSTISTASTSSNTAAMACNKACHKACKPLAVGGWVVLVFYAWFKADLFSNWPSGNCEQRGWRTNKTQLLYVIFVIFATLSTHLFLACGQHRGFAARLWVRFLHVWHKSKQHAVCKCLQRTLEFYEGTVFHMQVKRTDLCSWFGPSMLRWPAAISLELSAAMSTSEGCI